MPNEHYLTCSIVDNSIFTVCGSSLSKSFGNPAPTSRTPARPIVPRRVPMAHVDNVIFIPQVLKSFHILSVTILFIEHCTPLERLSQKAVNRLDDDPITRTTTQPSLSKSRPHASRPKAQGCFEQFFNANGLLDDHFKRSCKTQATYVFVPSLRLFDFFLRTITDVQARSSWDLEDQSP